MAIGGVNNLVYKAYLDWKYQKHLEISKETIEPPKPKYIIPDPGINVKIERMINNSSWDAPQFLKDFVFYMFLTKDKYERVYQMEKERERILKKKEKDQS